MPATTSTVDLSKASIRERAVRFAARWRGVESESAEKQTFWNELFEVFGLTRRQVAAFEELAKRASTGNIGWIDLLYPGQMAVEHKSAGEDLRKALGQVLDYLPSLHNTEFPWLLVVSDFENFAWKNLDTGQEGEFKLADLPHNLEVFWWMAGHGASPFASEEEEQANLVATGHMANLYDELLASGYDEHALREWLTRILFCLFADDTDVWDRAGFHTFIARYTHQDGHDLGPMLAQLFQVLDTPPDHRARTLDEDLAAFTYINGDLFANRLPIPSCNGPVRDALLDACRFDWSAISPSIFGSMFQNVMQPKERRQLGAHYTTERNILRTIRPLFLDDLEAELAAADTRPKIERFLDKLPALRFMDPACGCGNFLVIAYREIRRLETEGLRRLMAHRRRTGMRTMNLDLLCKVNVAQFFGIEIEEFPARIARTALYLADHIANREISAEFGELFVRFPIPSSPHIEIANALRMDWGDLLPAVEADYVFGNPPFVGMSLMTAEQQADNRFVFGSMREASVRSGRLDYVANWYAKAVEYADGLPIRFAFVSTNSMWQGEQARSIGPFLTSHGFKLDFAYRTFAWSSEARGPAHVHVVIVGFSHGGQSRQKTLFEFPEIAEDPIPVRATNINCYLVAGPDVAIGKHRQPFIDLPVLTEGNRPEDGGGLIVESNEYDEVVGDPVAAKYLHRLVGARDLLNGGERWCLWLVDAEPHDLRASHVLAARLERVRRARLAAVANTQSENRRALLRRLAERASLFVAIRQPANPYLIVPRHSSSDRRIIPMAMLEPDVIAHDSTLTLDDAPLWLFGVLQSALWTVWVKTICGRIKSDTRLAPDLAYNAFPWTTDFVKRSVNIAEAMENVLRVRERFPESSLADLYDHVSTPPALSKSHDELDRAVDAAFAPRRRFSTDADRLTLLFERYQALVEAGTLGGSVEPPRSSARRRAPGTQSGATR